ncbi:brain tumor protein-like [Paramacrobiotus metropolitanus]|uniref:brain tumor protein-like n=1 Tax=Paramacrobiotus metropolitanus TaxID=2943436 RepID=UPI0024460464|nr:brain tumor protein-like [Paramacrobiotus metropolitanus]XP_055340071.1 brain tumor protein-like [Paramacrobiotus metropolitanus]XP_055340072.1 brain tumor protein-like [Paramacrobiotus metropolitanus]XP_055340073.1 brain tumor protein-like [Paramacrobiotus metropolitanus]
MTSLSPSGSSLSSDDMASSLTGGQRTSPTNSLTSDASNLAPEVKLHCTICSETFRSPKVLQCMHSFCAACLDTLAAQDGPDRITCPECHVMTKLPPNGVAGLLPDYGMIRLLNLANPSINQFASGGAIAAERYCTSCKGAEKFAQAQCIDCANLLCANCVVAHQLMHCFNRHRVCPLQTEYRPANAFGFGQNFPGAEFGMGTGGMKMGRYDAYGRLIGPPLDKPQVSCPVHAMERLDFFCSSCDIPVCKDCIMIDHPKSQHDVAAIAEVGQREIAGLMQMKEIAQAKADEFSASSSEANLTRITASYHAAQAAIEDTLQFYVQVLKERRDELLQNLESIYEERQVASNLIQERSIDCSRRLSSVCQFMDRLLTYGSDAEILLFKRQLTHLVDTIMNAHSESSFGWSGDIQFNTNYQAIQSSVQNSYGFLQKKSDNTALPVLAHSRSGHSLNRLSTANSGSHRSIPSLAALSMGDGPNLNGGNHPGNFNFPAGNGMNGLPNGAFDRTLPSAGNGMNIKRSSPAMYPFGNAGDMNIFDKWMENNSSPSSNSDSFFNLSSDTLIGDDATPSKGFVGAPPARQTIRRLKMAYIAKFGDFGTGDGQFSEPSGVAVNAHRDILVADTNNHRVQIFDHEGRFKFAFGECGKRDGQMLYPNRVAVARNGDVVVTERSPTHQIQVYNQYGAFVRKFGADILQHPRGVTVDNRGRVIVVECKVMRVVIFEPNGRIFSKFACSQHLEFPNGVATNDNEEIFISDNRAHCVKVFNYHGVFLRQIGGEGVTNFPIGVCITERGHVIVADNHNNFNLTIFRQDGSLITAYESRVKHAQCFDVTLMDEGSVVLASKDYKVYVYRFANFGNSFPVVSDAMQQHSVSSSSSLSGRMGAGGNPGVGGGMGLNEFHMNPMKNLVKMPGVLGGASSDFN